MSFFVLCSNMCLLLLLVAVTKSAALSKSHFKMVYFAQLQKFGLDKTELFRMYQKSPALVRLDFLYSEILSPTLKRLYFLYSGILSLALPRPDFFHSFFKSGLGATSANGRLWAPS